MNVLNVVIAGAAKYGSVSVDNWLADHPEAGSSREKVLRSRHLQAEFQPQVQELVKLLGRGLSSWSNL